jgi:hypothetical protein
LRVGDGADGRVITFRLVLLMELVQEQRPL